jgi:uncharacterized phage infection (PIP) family protein YhgE
MEKKEISWPVPRSNGMDVDLGDTVIKHVPNNVDQAGDSTLKVLHALLTAYFDAKDAVEQSAASTGNVIRDRNSELPDKTEINPQVAMRLTDLESATRNLREWMSANQKSYADHENRIRELEYRVTKPIPPASDAEDR